jgi:hypothetical protein
MSLKQRWSAMMITDKGEGEKFVPQRPGESRDNKASKGEKRDRSVSSEDSGVDKEESAPAEEALAVIVAEGTKPRQKRKRTKKSKVIKSEVLVLQSEKGVSAPDWMGSITSVPDRALSTSISCDSAGVTPVHSAAAHAQSPDRPTWGTMKDYGDDMRIDKEWGQWGKDAVRKARDDKMRGRSPPPRERKGPADRMCEGGPWGEASDGSTRGWGSPKGCSPDLVRSDKGESSSRDLVDAPEPKKPWNRTRRSVRMSNSSSSADPPKLSSRNEESTFLVKVKKGEDKAKVLFLNNQKSTGWEGPFDTSLTMEDMLDFSVRPAPRAHTWPVSVMESEPSSEGEGSEGSDRSGGKKESPFEKGLDPHLEGGRGAGYLEVVESAKKAGAGYRAVIAQEKLTQAEWEAY